MSIFNNFELRSQQQPHLSLRKVTVKSLKVCTAPNVFWMGMYREGGGASETGTIYLVWQQSNNKVLGTVAKEENDNTLKTVF